MTATLVAPARPEIVPIRLGPAGRTRHPWLVVLVGCVVLVGIVLRFAARSDLWLDEALSVNIARLPLVRIPGALRQDGAPPLYYVLLHGWLTLFGSSTASVRALSGLFSVASLPLIWCVGRRVGGRAGGWIAVLILSISPYAVRYATETRMYALQMFLVILGYLAVVRALDHPAVGRLAGVTVVTSLLLYTHYWSLYLVGVVGVGLAIWAWRAPGARQRSAGRSTFGAVTVGVVLFLPWVPTLLFQFAHTGTPWGEPVPPTVGLSAATTAFVGGPHVETSVLKAALFVLVLVGVFGRGIGRRIELRVWPRPGIRVVAGVALLTLLSGLSVAYLAGSTFDARYAAVVYPLVVLVAAKGVLVLADPKLRFVVLAIVLGLGVVTGLRNAVDRRTQAGAVADVIRAEARPGDLVIYCPDQLGPATNRVLGPQPRPETVTFPDHRSGDRVNWIDYVSRNDATDPQAFGVDLLVRAADRHVIWYVTATGYPHLDGRCAELAAVLQRARPARRRVTPDPHVLEPEALIEYGAPR